MKDKSLPFLKAARAAFVVLLLAMAGLSQAFAQNAVPEGALGGLFTVSEGQQVYFSQGNLQYQASTNTWRFAESQTEYLGAANENASETYDGWIDLFGWGTSGYNHGAVCCQPWSASGNYPDYYLYGTSAYNLFDQSGQADWGYNAISNGGNQENKGWRTLTHEEWDYVLYTRNTESGLRFAKAQVDGVNGLIVVPDEWSASVYALDDYNNVEAGFGSNVISAETWNSSFQPNDAVFLSAAGCKIWNSTSAVGSSGYYWSATCNDYYDAWDVFFNEEGLGACHDYYGRARGQSVRLVRDVTESMLTTLSDDFNDGEINPAYWTSCGSDVIEADGLMQIQQNITDDFVALESVPIAIPSDNKFVLNRKLYLHEQLHSSYWGDRYYYGKVTFKINGSDDNYIEIDYYDDDYEGRHGTYIRTQIDGSANETRICDVLFGVWQTEVVVLDLAQNTLTYCRNNVLIATVALPTVAPEYFTVRFKPDGWWTGHLHNMDYVAINPEETSYAITVSSNIPEWGTVTGGGIFNTWETCTVTATPSEGYSFMGWIEEDGQLVSSNPEYDFVVLFNDRDLMAVFMPSIYVTATVDPADGGTVNGTGAFYDGATCTLTAVANEGYVFSHWTNNGETVSTDADYTFSVSSDPLNLVAHFVDVNQTCNLLIHMYDTYGDGWNGNSLVLTLADGSEQFITLDNGASGTSSISVIDGTVVQMSWSFGNWPEECSFDVNFENDVPIYHGQDIYNGFNDSFFISCSEATAPRTITAVAEPEEAGTIIGAGTYESGQYCTLEAVPSTDWQFSYWSEDGVEVSYDPSLYFMVTADRNLVAHFVMICTVDPENLQVEVQKPDCTEAIVTWESDNDLFELRYGKTAINSLSEGFESGIPSDWATIDADGDGYTWAINGGYSFGGYYSSNCIASASYVNYVGALTPDNYLVTPMLNLGGTFSFWACAQDSGWASEHFGVAVSTGSQTDASSFTTIQEWTMTSKGRGAPTNMTRSGNRDQGTWYHYTVDLSDYAGQTGYIAIRHFNCSDWFFLDVDDVEYEYAAPSEWTTITDITDTSYTITGLDEMTDYIVQVRSLCDDGETYSNWVEIPFTNVHYTITASVNPEEGGSVTGSGIYLRGEHVVLEASMNEGYQFVNWTENDEVISNNSYYEFDATSDRELMAHVVRTCTLDPDYIEAYHQGFTEAEVYWYGVNDLYDLRYRTTTREGFEYGIPGDWATIDADGDGYTWYIGDPTDGHVFAGYNSSQCASSASYINSIGVLTPDNYLVTPQLNLGGTFTFWAAAQDAYYAAEYFGVAVSTGSQTDPADFTMVQEWTMTSKGVSGPKPTTRGDNRDPGNWYYYEVDLSDYAGQTGYVAIRHFNCTDMFFLLVDNVEYFETGGPEWTMVTDIVGSDYYDNYYNLFDLEDMSDYLIEVRASCGDGESYSNWIGTELTTTHYTVNLVSDPEGVAEFSGSGTGYYGSNCYVWTQPWIAGYRFVNWTRDGEVFTDDQDFYFTLTEDVTFVANYEPYPEVEGQMEYLSYDWQSNDAARTWTHAWPNGDINFAYTVAKDRDYTDRGTGIGTYHAETGDWTVVGGRVENEKTGFGSIAQYGENGLVIVAHTPIDCRVYIAPDKDQIEPNSLEAVSVLDNTYVPVWPAVMTSGANRDIIHVAVTAQGYDVPGAEGVTQAVLYFRSTDGGQTWDKQNVILPYLGSENGQYWNSNSFHWMETTPNNRLALVVNNAWSDGMVLYSDDDGETWERKVFYQHPGPFDYQDAFYYPRWVSCQWDSDGKLHVLYEYNGALGYPGEGSYYPQEGGVAYWNEDMEVMDKYYVQELRDRSWYHDNTVPMPMEYIGYLPPLTDDGDPEDPYNNTGFNIGDFGAHGSYNSGVCAFPVLCMVPGSDDMVAVWAAMDENHTDDYGRHYYKIFGRYSANAGQAWSPMVQLTKDETCTNYEHVFLQAAVVGRTLVVAAQVDGETGSYLMGDDYEMANNFYRGFSFDLDETFVTTPLEQYVVTVAASPEEGGTVSEGGEFYEGAFITLQADSNPMYEFANWTFNGEVISTEPHHIATVTGEGVFTANFLPYLESLSDDFNDGEINTEYWVATGSDVVEEYGQIELLQNVEEDNVRLTTRPMVIPESRQIRMNRSFYVQTTGEPFRGGLGINFDNDDNNYIQIAYFNDYYLDRYGTYVNAVINGEYTDVWLCDALFNTWIEEKVEIDLTAGTLLYYQGNELISEVTVNGLSSLEATSFKMYFWPYGWYTGHYQFMDYININADVTEATITAIPSLEEGGTVTGGGVYPIGETCTLTATANARYEFLGWQRNGLAVSDENPYSFTVTSNADYVALIQPITYHDITASADPEEGGTVSGAGEFAHGEYCWLEAQPAEGYLFTNWTLNGEVVSTDPGYGFYVYEGGDYIAHFVPIEYYEITATADPVEGGTINGAGVCNQVTTCVLEAIPAEGYLFQYWTYNGEIVSTATNYSFVPTESGEYVAHFVLFNGVFVGDVNSTNTTYILPNNCYYKYSLTQQIYTSEEIGNSAEITAVSFFCTSNPKDLSRVIDIYMVHTDKSAFESDTDWITVTEADRVFSHEVTYTAENWNTFVLDQPFQYNGTDNLALIVDDNSGHWESMRKFRVFNADGNQAIRVYNDNIDFDPFNPGQYSGTLMNVKNQILFWTAPEVETLEQTYAIEPGWNWMSSYLECSDELFTALKEGIAANNTSAVIKNMDGSVMLQTIEQTPVWNGSMPFVNESMYMMNVGNATEVTLTASPANPAAHPITLTPGWNWIGFPSTKAMDLTEALSGITPNNGDVIKNMDGVSTFNSTYGVWQGNLSTLDPGNGYMYYNNSTEPMILVFPGTAPMVQGSVEIPEGMDASNIIITNFSEEVVPNEDGEFEIPTSNMLVAKNNQNDNIVYLGLYSIEHVDRNDRVMRDDYVLDAKETAILLALRLLPFDMSDGDNEVLDAMKAIVYSLPCVQDLEVAIQNTVATYGYLEEDGIADAVAAVANFFNEELSSIEVEDEEGLQDNMMPRQTGLSDPEFYPTNHKHGIKLFINEAQYLSNPDRWSLNCNGYSSLFCPVRIAAGYLDPTYDHFTESPVNHSYTVRPLSLSQYVKLSEKMSLLTLGGWAGWLELYRQMKHALTDEQYLLSLTNVTMEGMTFELPRSANAIGVLTPKDDHTVRVSAVLYGVLDVLTAMSPVYVPVDPLVDAYLLDAEFLDYCKSQPNDLTGYSNIINAMNDKISDVYRSVFSIDLPLDIANAFLKISNVCDGLDAVLSLVQSNSLSTFALPVVAEYYGISLPTVTTTVNSISSNSATVSGSVEGGVSEAIVECGFVYGDMENSERTFVAVGSGTGSFETTIEGLITNHQYYVMAYAKTSAGDLIYGEEKTFTLSNGGLTVHTFKPVVTSNAALFSGAIDGIELLAPMIIQHGFSYGTAEDETYTVINLGEGEVGETFSASVEGLTSDTEYSVIAYAVIYLSGNTVILYGNEVNFNTTDLGDNLVYNGDFELGNTGFETDYTWGNTGSYNHYYVGHDIAEMWSWDSPGFPVNDHTSGSGMFLMVDGALQNNTTAWSQTVNVTPNTDYEFSAWFLTNNVGYLKFEINGVSGSDFTTPQDRWVWEQRKMTWNSGDNTQATIKIINRYAQSGGYDWCVDDIFFGTISGSGGGNTGNISEGGALNGVFTINADGDQVNFSQGNLQYQASTNTWRFAEHQWDYVGADNANISETNSGWIDLFGWGTSGYNHGATCYQPWSTSDTYWDSYYAYGNDNYNLFDQTGQADWGYNAISNGGNQENSGWRTPTQGEWNYLLYTRSSSSGIRFAKACVNNVNGVILLPDDWNTDYYTLNSTNTFDAGFSSNNISTLDWTTLEGHGAVFLPAAGYRQGAYLGNVGSRGYYWSASYHASTGAWRASFNDSSFGVGASNRYFGHSVRLVRSAQ